MKVFLHYEDNNDKELWKTLKITLPKSWKNGPTSKLLAQFMESYNATPKGDTNPLQESSMHLAIRKKKDNDDTTTTLSPLASDDIILDCLLDRADVYVCHGASTTKSEQAAAKAAAAASATSTANTVQCKRFGCQKRFPPGQLPTDPCQHHVAPPVFHETAKFWSCCPHKKVYDWDDFQAIPGCQTVERCTEVKDDDSGRQFLGGTDLREKATAAVALKSIDDFNQEQAGVSTSSTLERVQVVLGELDIDKELFDQVVEGMKEDVANTASPEECVEHVKKELSKVIKTALKAVVVEKLRLK